jgi:hypothetical protein
MQAGHRRGKRFAGLVSDAPILVAPSLRIRVHGAPRSPAAIEARLAVHQPERSFS